MPHQPCTARNAKGEPCKSTSVGPDGLCAAHRKTLDGTGFGGPQPGSGRPRKLKPQDVLRAYLDEKGEELGQAVFGVLVRLMASQDEMVRLRAAVELGNRMWGRPAQAVELSGSVETTITPMGRLALEDPDLARLADEWSDRLVALDAGTVRGSG
jgi:hypothetical protein